MKKLNHEQSKKRRDLICLLHEQNPRFWHLTALSKKFKLKREYIKAILRKYGQWVAH